MWTGNWHRASKAHLVEDKITPSNHTDDSRNRNVSTIVGLCVERSVGAGNLLDSTLLWIDTHGDVRQLGQGAVDS
jgi:hypothetical protein